MATIAITIQRACIAITTCWLEHWQLARVPPRIHFNCEQEDPVRYSISVLAMMAMLSPALAQGTTDDVPGRKAGPPPTSDRTPEKTTPTPLNQVTQTPKGATSDRTPSNNPDASNAGQQGSQSQTRASSGHNTGRPAILTPAKLRQSLEKTGFRDIIVVDAAYLVHARNSDGDTVIMTINPPTIAAAMVGSGAGSSSSGSGSAAGISSGSGSAGSGSSDRGSSDR